MWKWRRVNGILHYCTHEYVGNLSICDTACGRVEAHKNPPIGCFYGVTPLHVMFEDLCEECVTASGEHPARPRLKLETPKAIVPPWLYDQLKGDTDD